MGFDYTLSDIACTKVLKWAFPILWVTSLVMTSLCTQTKEWSKENLTFKTLSELDFF